jgi:hypothetical protein
MHVMESHSVTALVQFVPPAPSRFEIRQAMLRMLPHHEHL